MTNSNYCSLNPYLRPSVEDKLSEGTKRQLNALNLKYEEICGKIGNKK